ncbi:hypothetical protein ACL02T_29795 [Pseudonocardia sp. RS010]|uniref:hypothetical protein n=1 Tax=Pseudonocardia sp. RS010 TaxID=3385979 RepID=UPI0039A064AC
MSASTITGADLAGGQLGSCMVTVALVASAAWFTRRWLRTRQPRQDTRRSAYVTRVLVLASILALLAAGVVLFGARALDLEPLAPLVVTLAIPSLLAGAAGLLVGGVLRGWEPCAAVRRDAALVVPGSPVRWQVGILAVLGALAGVFVAGVVSIALIVAGLIVAPWTVGVWLDEGSFPPWLLGIYMVTIAGCAAGAGYREAIRLRRDQLDDLDGQS